ncbi:SHOCT domain-containing protein [Gordonia sp. NPDC003424]
MESPITPAADAAVADIADRHGISRDAVLAMLLALRAGGGQMAQFNIPELGGSGQWMRGGMIMVGNMFDNALKARVDALCNELSQLLDTTTVFRAATAQSQVGFGVAANNWWPEGLGVPSSTGAQNGVRYAIFPATHRLVIEYGGAARVYDTGEHAIGGVQQQQGGPVGTVGFTSQLGTFSLTTLRELNDEAVADTPAAAPEPDHRARHRAPSDASTEHPSPTSSPAVQPTAAPAPSSPAAAAPPAAAARPAATPPTAAPAASSPAATAPQAAAPAPSGTAEGAEAIVAAIESLAGLHQRGILTDEEFTTKKAELLSRL